MSREKDTRKPAESTTATGETSRGHSRTRNEPR